MLTLVQRQFKLGNFYQIFNATYIENAISAGSVI